MQQPGQARDYGDLVVLNLLEDLAPASWPNHPRQRAVMLNLFQHPRQRKNIHDQALAIKSSMTSFYLLNIVIFSDNRREFGIRCFDLSSAIVVYLRSISITIPSTSSRETCELISTVL